MNEIQDTGAPVLSPIPSPEMPLENAAGAKGKNVVIGAVLVILMGLVGYLFWQNRTLSSRLAENPSPVSSPVAVINTESGPASTVSHEGWEVSTLKDKTSTISYPAGWKFTDNTAQEDLYNDGKLQWAQSVVIEKDGYKIVSVNPLAWGPNVCIFPDSPDYKKENVYGEKYSEFIAFTGADGEYRRVKSLSSDLPGIQRWTICTGMPETASFGTVSGFGATYYETPVNFDESTLSIMDQILTTFTKVKQQ